MTTEEFQKELEIDATEKINAGAQLVYALYHSKAEWISAMPDPVFRALLRAQDAYGVHHPRRTDDDD